MKVKLSENRLKQIVAESVKKVLIEGTVDQDIYGKWNDLLTNVGAETMLDCIYQWASSDEIKKWIEWFEEEGYFGEY